MQIKDNTIYLLVLLVSLFIPGLVLIFGGPKRKRKKSEFVSPELLMEKKKFMYALIFPGFFLFILWFVKIIEIGFDADFTQFGIFPMKWDGLTGIITAPLIHADFNHLIDNSVPIFLLSLAVFYFYREISYKIFFIVYFVTGLLVWIAGREAYHIGASGLIYGFASFLFFSGVLRKNINLLAISLLVTFLYGSMIWGILPYDYQISWESHLMGAITGTTVAFLYRSEGPERKKYSWEEEDEDENEDQSESIQEIDKNDD